MKRRILYAQVEWPASSVPASDAEALAPDGAPKLVIAVSALRANGSDVREQVGDDVEDAEEHLDGGPADSGGCEGWGL